MKIGTIASPSRYDAAAETATITPAVARERANIRLEAMKCVWHNMPYHLAFE
jgi:hypothetical protein